MRAFRRHSAPSGPAASFVPALREVSHALGIWELLDQRIGTAHLRPRLSDDVRLRRLADRHELIRPATGDVLPLRSADLPILARLDGTCTVGELVVEGIGDTGALAIEPVLSLVDRLVRSEMLADCPAPVYRRLAARFEAAAAMRAGQPRKDATVDADLDEPAASDDDGTSRTVRRSAQADRSHTLMIADRVRFLAGVQLLAGLDSVAIAELAEQARVETWHAASEVVVEGTDADRFYIVRSGEVNIDRREEDGTVRRLARLGPGDWFGETGLLERSPRNATARTGISRPAQLYSFDQAVFDRLIGPLVASTRDERVVSQQRAALDQVPLFQSLAQEDLDRLAGVLREEHVERGTVLFRQDEPADCFYVIRSGAVGVVRDGEPIARLGPGEFFGETGLLFTDRRTATVATTEPSSFWVLDRESFTTFLRDSLLHRHELMPTVLGRIASRDPL
jgi:CRP-like cAMP-binding protein